MAEEQNVNMGEEMVKAMHGAKSYMGHAFGAWILYYVGFYVIGLVANLIFLANTKETMRITGTSPSGRGCLLTLLWVHLVIPFLVVLALFGFISLPFIN